MENTQPVKQTKICKYCKSEIPKDAKICPHCRKRVALGMGGKIIAGFFGFIVLVLVISSVSGGGSNSSTPSAVSSSVNQGQNGYLHISDGQSISVVRTKQGLDDYTKAAVNNDTLGMAQMIYDGEGFLAPDDTKVLVIDSGLGTREVRILDGKFIGQSGWVPMEFVHPATTTQ